MSRSIKRVVSTSFWEDSKVMTLFTPEDKYFMLYLLTNPHTTQLGVYQLVPKVAAFEMGYSVEAVNSLIDRFETKYDVIRYNPQTMEVAVKNYLKHSILKGGKPVLDLLITEERQVKDKSLLNYIYDSISKDDSLNITVKEYIEHINTLNTVNNNNNINNNDNERIVPRIVDESSKSKKTKGFKPPMLQDVTNYCVLNKLTYVNPEAFIDFYESKNWMVGKNKMSNWKSALSGWNRRAKERGEKEFHIVPETPIRNDRPERWKTCPDSLWQKLKPYAHDDGSFDWPDFDTSVLAPEDREWMRRNDM